MGCQQVVCWFFEYISAVRYLRDGNNEMLLSKLLQDCLAYIWSVYLGVCI